MATSSQLSSAGSRREARERALELLYEAESKDVDVADVVASLALTPDPYAVELALGVADHAIELDRLLGRYSRDWPVERMAVMDRSVMRVGSLELATQTDLPSGVILSEAVELAAQYGSTDDTSRFVNGILASVVAEVRDGNRPWRPIDTVVFDMDGVIRHWDAKDLDGLDLTHDEVVTAAFDEQRLAAAMTGGLTLVEWSAEIGRVLSPNDPHRAAAIADAWAASDWTLDPAVVSLVERVQAAGLRTAVLSNATDQLEAHLEEMGIAGLFDVVCNSWRLGAAKPEPAIYEAADAAIGEIGEIDGGRTLFVDDRPGNVAAAVDHGWHAVVMRSAERLDGVFARLGVLDVPEAS